MKSNFVKASMSTPTRVLETELDPGAHSKDEDDGGHGSELDERVVVEGGGVDDAIAKDQSERLLSTG